MTFTIIVPVDSSSMISRANTINDFEVLHLLLFSCLNENKYNVKYYLKTIVYMYECYRKKANIQLCGVILLQRFFKRYSFGTSKTTQQNNVRWRL